MTFGGVIAADRAVDRVFTELGDFLTGVMANDPLDCRSVRAKLQAARHGQMDRYAIKGKARGSHVCGAMNLRLKSEDGRHCPRSMV